MYKLSVIIPVYNVERFLPDCLKSLTGQSFQDAEFIFIDDDSTDASLRILTECKDDRIKILTQKNAGQGIARNNGLKAASGEYIVFLDSDDWLEDDALDKIYNKFQQTNAEVIQFNYKIVNDFSGEVKKRNLAKLLEKNFKFKIKDSYSIKDVKSGCFTKLEYQVWNKAYKRSFLESNNIFFAPAKNGEDHIFTNMTLLNCSKIYYLDEYLYNYRCRKNSAVNSISDENFRVFDNIKIQEEYLSKIPIFSDLQKEFKEYKIHCIGWHYRQIPKENREKYKSKSLEILTEQEYKQAIKIAEQKNSLIENIFSLKTKREQGLKYKIITILGIKIVLRKSK